MSVKYGWIGAGVVFLMTGGVVFAEQFAFVGSRAGGMGGANAASTRDATAQWHNPAAFGFMGKGRWEGDPADNAQLAQEDFGWEVFGLSAGITLTEDMGRYLDILADIEFSSFESGQLDDPENVRSLLAMAGVVGGLDAGDALYADFSAGSSVQIGQLGVGIRVFGEAAGWTLPDTERLSINGFTVPSDIAAEIDAAAGLEGFAWGGSYTTLSDQQRADLGASLGVTADSDTVKYLDSKLSEIVAAGDLTSGEVSDVVDLMDSIAAIDPAFNIESNQTAVVGRGFSVVEVPVSYGWALNKNLSVGVTAKAMYGSVLGTRVWVFDDDNSEVLNDVSDNREDSLTFGVDFGVLYRIPNFQFAVVGHNLNRPTFGGFTDSILVNGRQEVIDVPDVKIDPQITTGVAFIPARRLTVEANLDLLETGTLLDGYNIQRFSVGGEFDVWVLALRLGAYRNLAESWQDWVATAGVSAKLLGIRLDIGGAYSLGNTVEYDGTEYPSESRLFASVGMAF